MIFIVVKYQVKPESAEQWMDIVQPFTEATRAEAGNLWFEWSRSVENPNDYVLVEAFRDGDAGSAHVTSEHFRAAMATLPQALVATPRIVSQSIEQSGWDELGEMKVG